MRDPERALAGRNLDLTDGIKVFEDARLGAGAPGPGRAGDPPLRRGREPEVSEELAGELRAIIEDIEQGEAAHART